MLYQEKSGNPAFEPDGCCKKISSYFFQVILRLENNETPKFFRENEVTTTATKKRLCLRSQKCHKNWSTELGTRIEREII
jgi:hypothetical protein